MNRFAYLLGLCLLGMLLGTSASAKSPVTPISEMNLEFTPCAVELDPSYDFIQHGRSQIPQTIMIVPMFESDSLDALNLAPTMLMNFANGTFSKSAEYMPFEHSHEPTSNGLNPIILALSETEAVYEHMVPSTNWDDVSLSGSQYRLFNSITGVIKDITPANLDVINGNVDLRDPDLYSVLYSYDIGFIFFVPKENGTTELWEGKELLDKVQEISDVVLIGRAFSDEGLTTVLATSKGNAYVFSYGLRKLVPSEKFDFLAHQAIQYGARRPCKIVFASDFVTWEDDTLPIKFADKLGRFSTLDIQVPPLDKDAHPDLGGKKPRASDLSCFAICYPFDSKRVVFVDELYRRCVIISPKK
jgi:hypothetical protein